MDDAEKGRKLQLLRDNFRIYGPAALKIKTKKGEVLSFELNRAQQFLDAAINEQLEETGKVRVLVLKGRQQGISTYTEGRFYWRTSMQFGKTAFIMTHEDKATHNLFGMAKLYHEHVPGPIKPSTGAANANELVFDKLGSKYAVGTARTSGTGRSYTVQYFHGSEVAFWANATEHLAGLGQAIPDEAGTEVILESTANGVGNVFHSMVQDALRGVGDYRLVFIPWFWQTEYRSQVADDFTMDHDETLYLERHGLVVEQIAWRRKKIQTDFRGDVSLFDQEYPATPNLAFRAGDVNSYIGMELVDKAMATKVAEDAGVPKILGVDPAEYGDDATAIVRRQGRKVFPIKRHYKRGPMEVVGIVARDSDEWHPDAINIDCTGVGSGIADRLTELGYPVNRVHFGERAIESEQYRIRKDEMYGETKAWLENVPCELPTDDVLAADLVAPTYTYDSSRRLVIESKEKMKARGLKSPDSADALALTFAVPMNRARGTARGIRMGGWRS
jgi:hypothetical protein